MHTSSINSASFASNINSITFPSLAQATEQAYKNEEEIQVKVQDLISKNFRSIIDRTKAKSIEITPIHITVWMKGFLCFAYPPGADKWDTNECRVDALKLLKQTTYFLGGHLKALKSEDLANSFFCLQDIKEGGAVTRDFLALLSEPLKNVTLNLSAISKIFQGLQNLLDSEELNKILKILGQYLGKIKFNAENFDNDSQDIGLILYSLQNKLYSPVIIPILQHLTRLIEEATKTRRTLDNQVVINALWGLQNMVNKEATYETLCLTIGFLTITLANHIQRVKHAGSERALITLDDPEKIFGKLIEDHQQSKPLNTLLRVIIPHIATAQFNGEQLSSLLYGLKNMRDSQSVLKILKIIAEKIKGLPDQAYFTVRQISKILYSLQYMSILADPIFEALMPHIVQAIERGEKFTAVHLSRALYGLQNMHDSEEVRVILRELTKAITETTQLNAKAIDNILQGLYSMPSINNTDEIIALLIVLKKHLAKVENFPKDLLAKKRVFVKAIHHLSGYFDLVNKPSTQQEPRLVSLAREIYNFLENLDKILELQLDAERVTDVLLFRSSESLLEFIQSIGEYRTIKEFERRRKRSVFKIRNTTLDLHETPYTLARKLCKDNLGMFLNNPSNISIKIVFGSAKHNPFNKGKMRNIVWENIEEMKKNLGTAKHAQLFIKEEKTFFLITRHTKSLKPSSAGRKSGRPH
jgi:hypothetical protein